MSNMDMVFDQAYKLFEEKKFDSALEKISQAENDIELNSMSDSIDADEMQELRASIFNFKGYNYLGMGENELAKRSFEEALKINPNSSQACAGLGEVFYICGMDQEAKILYEWGLDLNPHNKVAEGGLQKTNRNLGLPNYHYTLNIDMTINKKEQFYSKVTKAYSSFADGNYSEALEGLAALDGIKNPMYQTNDSVSKASSLENFKGFNHLALQNYEKAQICFEKALHLNPNSSQACAGLGEIFHLDGKEKESKAMYEWAVKNNQNNQFAVMGLAKVNRVLGFTDNHSFLDEK